ncbi:MAG: tetratricopeptide repeat protein [Leptolyngbya sp. SIO1E4]|nr:tetratricopeptide repeat protein [Leptolyngbya sp. SIO1E4]
MLQRYVHVVDLPLLGRYPVGLTCHQCKRWPRLGFNAVALIFGLLWSDGLAIAAPQPPPETSFALESLIAQVNLEELEDFEYWQRLCRLQTDAQEYEEAQQACEQAIEIRPEDASIWADHSGVLLQLAQYPEAIASADLSLTYNLENSLAFTYQCIAFQALEDYETALDKCNEALRVNGDWGTESPALAWRHRGEILDQQGQSELALVAYERTLLLTPEDSLTLTYQCRALFNLTRYPDAIASCQEALAGNQQWGDETPALAWFYQGLAHSALASYADGVAAYDQAIALAPNRAETWIQQGWALEHLDRPTEALTSYTRAVELAPESSRALVGQCTVFNQLARYKEAVAACQQAIQGDGQWWPLGSAQAWSEQAQALAGTGQFEEAWAASNRAVGIRPDYAEAWSNRSVVLWYLGVQEANREQAQTQAQAQAQTQAQAHFTAAEESARRSIELDNTVARPWANLGRILRSQGQLFSEAGTLELAATAYQDALSAYEQALLLDEEDAGIWSNYSVVLWLLGQYEEALSAAGQAIHIDATSTQAWQNQGAVLVALGRYEAAQASYLQAVTLDDENAVAWASLGIIQLRLEQVEAGRASLDKALALDPEQPLAQQALDQLSQVMPMP